MKTSDAYFYQADDNHKYWLDPEFVLTPGDISIIGAGILNMAGTYLGYWDACNMPVAVRNSIKQWTRFNRSLEIGRRRMKVNEAKRALIK